MARLDVGITIREMASTDVPMVAHLEEAIYPQPWSTNVFRDELSLDNRMYLVACDGDEVIVGYGGMMFIDEDAHITTLAVAPTARGGRIGSRLMVAMIETALGRGIRHLTLEVRVSNAAAQSLYERFGFAPVGLRKNYYRNEDALVMWAIDVHDDDYAERLAAIKEGLA